MKGFSARVGDARRLPVDDRSDDAVLVLGPLDHLQVRADRVAVWREAAWVLTPGGVVIATAISRFASLVDGLAQEHRFCSGPSAWRASRVVEPAGAPARR